MIAGIELGGTKSVAVLAAGRTILDRLQVPTTHPGPTLAALVARVATWHAADPVDAIGIASFGPLALDPADPAFGAITVTTKPHWSHTDVRGAFARAVTVPIGFDTDVAGAALAEGLWGAAHGCGDYVYLTIGTGVGAGIVTGRRIVHGAVHPEASHIHVRRVPGDTFAGTCPFHGDCLEGLISGPALAARTGLACDAIPDTDPVWARAAADLAEVLAILVLTLAPERIVIGGGVATKRPRLLLKAPARTAALLGGYLPGFDSAALQRCIVPAGLGDNAGPLGAIALGEAALV